LIKLINVKILSTVDYLDKDELKLLANFFIWRYEFNCKFKF